MEYFVGAIVALGAVYFTNWIIKKEKLKTGPLTISYSQTNVFELLMPFLPDKITRRLPPTQSSKHYDKVFLKILVVDDKAYWIKENTFFQADLVDGDIDNDTTVPVDTMGMDKVQLDKMIFIIEKLTKGNSNDNWNSK